MKWILLVLTLCTTPLSAQVIQSQMSLTTTPPANNQGLLLTAYDEVWWTSQVTLEVEYDPDFEGDLSLGMVEPTIDVGVCRRVGLLVER